MIDIEEEIRALQLDSAGMIENNYLHIIYALKWFILEKGCSNLGRRR